MNALSYILAVLIAAAFVAAIVYCIKHRSFKKCSGCDKDCSHCGKKG